MRKCLKSRRKSTGSLLRHRRIRDAFFVAGYRNHKKVPGAAAVVQLALVLTACVYSLFRLPEPGQT